MHLRWLLFFCFSPGLNAVPLLMSWTLSIKLFEEATPNNLTTIPSLPSSKQILAVDYHYSRGEVYYSDTHGRIYRTWVKRRDQDPIVILEVVLSDGLAVDWVSDNLYWTDVNKHTVEMSTLDGLYRRTLFNSTHGVSKPRAIVLDPFKGIMFWSDWGDNARVESSGLDGQVKNTIVSTGLTWPNGLTLDLENEKLYILDGFESSLFSCAYDGTDLKTISTSTSTLQRGFGLTFYAGTLYWDSWKAHAAFYMNLATGLRGVVVSRSGLLGILERMVGFKAMHPSLQRAPTQAQPCASAGCSHECLSGRDLSPSCVCPYGFLLNTDSKTCVEEGYLLVSWRLSIRQITLHGTESQAMFDGAKSAVSIDYHYKKGLVFWSDNDEHRIYRAPLGQLNNKTVVTRSDTCDGLAVDWVHDILYWTDTGKNTLEASEFDGSKQLVLISEDLHEPRAIAIDPFSGYLFWTDWGEAPKIERAYLDGSNRSTIITEDLIWPNGITIDLDIHRIYWIDGKLATMSSSAYDGSQRKSILRSQSISQQPFAVTLLGDSIYWTDWSSNSLFKANKHHILDGYRLANSSTILVRPYGVRAVHSSLQKYQSNPCALMKCRELCLGSPPPEIARCMGTGTTDPETTSENLQLTYKVSNDSFELTLSNSKLPSLVVITTHCVSRNGCIDDERCSQESPQIKVFSNQRFFRISGLLPASNYNVSFKSPEHNEELKLTTMVSEMPEIPHIKSVDVNGVEKSVKLKWDPVDTCVPGFHSYNYRIYNQLSGQKLTLEGITNLTEVKLEHLELDVEFKAEIFTLDPKHNASVSFSIPAVEEHTPECMKEEELLCDGKPDCLDGSDENISICADVENITIFQKSVSEVYFRVKVTNRTWKQLEKFVVIYSAKDSTETNTFKTLAEPCIIWPTSYCFHISQLLAYKEYNFNVSVVLKGGKIGIPFSVNDVTKEGVPGSPEDVRAANYSSTTVEVQWRHPSQSKGTIRAFIINIHQVEAFDESKCCQSFPMFEFPATIEEPLYSFEATDFSPASTYAITITSKTIYMGGSREVDVYTAPPSMELLWLPNVNVSSLLPLSWQLRNIISEDNSNYQALIKFYLLVELLPQVSNGKIIQQEDIFRDVYPILESQLENRVNILWHRSVNDTAAFQEAIVPTLESRQQYQLAWVQVAQYRDAYSIDFIKSDSFMTL